MADESRSEQEVSNYNPFERLTAMGMLVERFAMLEASVREVTHALIEDPIAAHTLTAQASVGELLNIAQTILTECTRRGISRAPSGLSDALKRVRPILERRNLLFHNLHMTGDHVWQSTIWKYRRGEDRPTIIPMNFQELQQLDLDVNQVINDVLDNRPGLEETRAYP